MLLLLLLLLLSDLTLTNPCARHSLLLPQVPKVRRRLRRAPQPHQEEKRLRTVT
jgi:hypothetical protein